MRQNFIFLILFVCTAPSFAQKANKVVQFDFLAPVYPNVITVSPKQNIELVLTNVNKAAYDISVNDSLINYVSKAPAQFGQIFKLPELTALPPVTPAASDSVAGKRPSPGSEVDKSKKKEKGKQAELDSLLLDYNGIELSTKDLLSEADIVDELKKLITDCSSTTVQLKAKADTYLTSSGITAAPANFPLGIEPFVKGQIASVKSDINKLISRANNLKKAYQGILETADKKMSLETYQDLEKQINEKISLVEKILNNSTELKNKLAEFEKAKVGSEIVNQYNKIMTSRVEIRKLINTGFATDEVLIKINITKKAEMECLKEITSFPISAVVTGGVKIDFSTGIVFNLGNEKFFDQKYHYDSVYRNGGITDSVGIRRNNNNNLVMPSLGAFMNIYSRIFSHVNGGGLIGASLGTDQRVYYHIGGILIFGKSDRCIIGFGASISKSTVLDGQYKEDQFIKRSLAPSPIPTETANRVGWFINLAWNLNLIK